MSHFPSDSFRLGAANRDPEEEALGWVVRLTSGDAGDHDRREFESWRSEPENARAYDRAQRLWSGIGPILREREQAGWPDAAAEPDDGRRAGRARRRLDRSAALRYAAIAAAVVMSVGAADRYATRWQYDHVSDARVQEDVPLADGSRVTLGPDTAFTTDFRNGVRHVALARGEAFFDVRHDPAHPFVVSSRDGVVRVLGTAFTVRRRDDDLTVVTVSRGRVGVTSGARDAVLVPDRQIAFGPQGLGRIRAVDASLETAWTRGRLIMENRPLSQILEELDRYRAGRILLLNAEAGERRINAVIDLDRTDSWLTALASSQGLKLTTLGPVTVIR
ncbi:FecR family protein [Sphingomonas silueang]|uniref:FecR family protein n=1 Tax=Sphingomonas silueang TaxID=3156617 RepID=UPI0032B4F887